MATLTVHQATPDDATELARLLDLFDNMGATPEQVAARMLACQHVLTTFIGAMDGQVVGFACLRLICWRQVKCLAVIARRQLHQPLIALTVVGILGVVQTIARNDLQFVEEWQDVHRYSSLLER